MVCSWSSEREKQQGETNKRQLICWTGWVSEIFVARIFLEIAHKPYLGITFRDKVCLILVSDTGERGLLSYWGRRRREGMLPPQIPSVSLQWLLFILHGPWTWVIVVLKKKVTDLLQFFLTQSFSNLNVHGKQLGHPLKCRYGLSSSGVGVDFAFQINSPPMRLLLPQRLSILNSTPLKSTAPREQWANPSAPSH